MENTFITNVFYSIISIILTGNLIDGLDIISRESWSAKSPRITKPFPKVPEYVIITQTHTESCIDIKKCTQMVCQMQFMDMHQNDKNDIIDNFIIGGDGNVYEGRGWDAQPEEFRSYDLKSIFISFVGDYSTIRPTEEGLNAAKELLELGVAQNKIDKNYKLLAFRQIAHNVHPGTHLYSVIKTFPHWQPIPGNLS